MKTAQVKPPFEFHGSTDEEDMSGVAIYRRGDHVVSIEVPDFKTATALANLIDYAEYQGKRKMARQCADTLDRVKKEIESA